MPLWSRMSSLFLSDEELGKKDDDHRATKLPTMRGQQHWTPVRPSPRKTLKRLGLAILIGLAVYLFIHNIPTDLPQRDRRRPFYEHWEGESLEPFQPPPRKSKPPAPKKGVSDSDADAPRAQTYNGPVRFLNLAESLQAIQSTGGQSVKNKNVLFAASSLKSAATLLPIACQMGSELRNYVHFALMSRSEIDIDELRAVNGIDDSCHVIFHDARPDYSLLSTETRLATAAGRALYHINTYMHPQAVIVDASSTEDDYFLRSLRVQARGMDSPLIELPQSSQKHLSYLTKLDSQSLGAWNKFHVDVLIQAPPEASGSLIRLLKSLSAADYTSGAVPHLTIELPHTVDPPTKQFLEIFQWPPAHVDNPSNAKQLTLRHRIARWSLNEEESSIRFLESFWPANPLDSHVLVLSPQTELSPQFFHYLRYSVLEYKYSNAAIHQEWDTRLLGMSLDLPTTYLNTSTPLNPPTKKDAKNRSPDTKSTDGGPTPFLWQAPNSNAVLFFGQKWIELHGFVSRLVDVVHRLPASPAGFLSEKAVSMQYPSWLEHALRLSRARGYWTLYPGENTAGNLATVHAELYRAPEEYEEELGRDPEAAGGKKKADERRHGDGSAGFVFADRDLLPPFDEMPLVTWDGNVVGLEEFDALAKEYTADFRASVGGCEDLETEDLVAKGSAADLFCEREED